jgi:hypothetical protein
VEVHFIARRTGDQKKNVQIRGVSLKSYRMRKSDFKSNSPSQNMETVILKAQIAVYPKEKSLG